MKLPADAVLPSGALIARACVPLQLRKLPMRLVARLSLATFMAFSTLTSAHAADPSTPVKELLDAMMINAAGEKEFDDYFSEDRLGRLYSDDFLKTYRAAWKKQEADENGGYLLGYDPLLMAQDGCPIKDLSLETADDQGGYVPVAARFKAFYCLNDEYKDQVELRQFILVEKNGAFVVDDIQSVVNGKVDRSVKADLEALSK